MSRQQTKDAQPFDSIGLTAPALDKLFSDLRQLGRPAHSLIDMSVQLAFDNERQEVTYPCILVSLVNWLRDLHENEQQFLCDFLASIVTLNLSW